MAFTEAQQQQIRRATEYFLEQKRPPEEIRSQLDIACSIEGQSVFIFEIRPNMRLMELRETPIAKATFVKAHNHWKIFWMRGDLKWHPYTAELTVKSIASFFEVVMKDDYCCFFG